MFVGLILGLFIFNNRRSRNYKKTLCDLFVAGRIRQIAEDKAIDLDQEYNNFKSFVKKRRINSHSLSETIEEDLQHEIGEDYIGEVEEEAKKD